MAARKFLSGIDMASQKIVSMADGSAASDAATYGQMLNLFNGRDYKDGVRAGSTANITITAPGATIDGVAMASGDRVLLKDQTTPSQNGIWVWNGAASALTRPADFPTGSTGLVTQGATVVIDEGTANQASQYTLTTSGTINVDTTSQSWTRTTAAGSSYTAGNGISIASNIISVNPAASGGISVAAGGVSVDHTKVPFLFAANVGDGSSTAITVTHNLATRDVIRALYDATGFQEVETDVVHATTNTLTLNFAVAPTSNQYRIVVHG